jgi:dUTP pyrophosphatase
MGFWINLVRSMQPKPRGGRFKSMNVNEDRASTPREAEETTYVLKRPPPPSEEFETPLKVKKLSPNATLPVRASIGAAGYDLFSAEDCTIEPRTRKVVKTDLSMAIPARHYGRVAPRSGLSFKFGIDIAAGVIDSDYRGPLGIVMVNNGTSSFEVKAGDRVAQLLLERVSTPEVEEVEELDDTVRGNSGFGSTGTAALAKQA